VDGLANQNWVIANRNINNYGAFKACADLVENGHDDWYLPAIAELDRVYSYLVVAAGQDSDNPSSPDTCSNCGNNDPSGYGGPAAGSFDTSSGGWYWSSTQYDSSNTYDFRFQDGWRDRFGVKTSTSNEIRCVRRE
jgi:hypothetical protein